MSDADDNEDWERHPMEPVIRDLATRLSELDMLETDPEEFSIVRAARGGHMTEDGNTT